MRELRVGVVGMGVMGRHHLRILGGLEGVRLIGFCDPSPLVDKSTTNEVVAYKNLFDLIAQRPDYCVVAVPTKNHFHVARQLIENGIAVLIEKPIAALVNEAQELVDMCRSRGIVAGVGHVERFNPAVSALRQHILMGTIGNVIQVSTRRQGPRPTRDLGTGVVLDLATHDFDITTWITNTMYQTLTAETLCIQGSQNEDAMVASGRLTNGALVSHVVNWTMPYKEREIAVVGSQGALIANTLTADLVHYESGQHQNTWETLAALRGNSEGRVIRIPTQKSEPLLNEHVAFRDAVINKTDVGIVTLAEATRTLRVATAILSRVRTP